ncbi:CBS domain-containing protein [bacterium]|nr:CBS domain-containing protein [bacterium]
MKTAEEIVQKNKGEMITVSPDSTIREALNTMTEKNIGAILIKDMGKIVGIWTERDLMRNVLLPDFNLDSALIKDYMTTKLHFARHSDTIYHLQDKFLGLRIRHLLVKKKDQILGLVSSGDVSRHDLKEKTDELESLNKIINWEYYENWHW